MAASQGRPAAVAATGALGQQLFSAARSIVAARTWLAVIHLLYGTVTGLVISTVVLTGASIGFSLVGVLIGLPVLGAVLWLCGLFARTERARFRLMLGVTITPPPSRGGLGAGWWRRMWQSLVAPVTYKQLGYALLRFPLSVVQATIVVSAWASAAGTPPSRPVPAASSRRPGRCTTT